MGAGPLGGFMSRRETLISSATPGTAATRLLSDMTDEAVSALAEAAFSSSGKRWSVLALGAWGSQRLLPASDLDLLVIVGSDPRSARDAVQGLLYPLWDAGFEVGHAVRTRKEHARAAAENVETLTATLTGRCIAGDPAMAAELLRATATGARRRATSLLRVLSERERTGSPYDLEPDLKEGSGGQRDIDELTWRGCIAAGSPSARPQSAAEPSILHAGLLGELEIAQDRISAARWVLHRERKRKHAVLDLETAAGAPSITDDLHGALAVVSETILAVRGLIPAEDLRGKPWSADELLGAVRQGSVSLPRLETAARRGALDDLIPSLSGLMTLRRPALSHRYTVGAHSLLTAAYATELPATDRIAASAMPAGMTPMLLAACLAHDAGKSVSGPDHAERGIPAASASAQALGCDTTQAQSAAILVRDHLLLAETASGFDIDDEDVVLRCAARIGSRDLVGPLYVLTAADSMATGPDTWDAWHASLVRILVSRVDAALANDVDGAGMVTAAEKIRAASMQSASEPATAAILKNAPVRFFTGRKCADVVADATLLADLGPAGSRERISMRVSAGTAPGSHRLAIATYDHPGVFALAAGAIALSGLDILGATAYPGPSGTVLDTFTVVSATLAEVGPATWSALERRLAAAMDGHLDIGTRLAERRRQYPARSSGRVRIESRTESAFATALSVGSPDRPGLLFDIADEIARAGFTITRVNALTRNGRARDTFHIVDSEGYAPRDPGELGHLAMRVRERLAGLQE